MVLFKIIQIEMDHILEIPSHTPQSETKDENKIFSLTHYKIVFELNFK